MHAFASDRMKFRIFPDGTDKRERKCRTFAYRSAYVYLAPHCPIKRTSSPALCKRCGLALIGLEIISVTLVSFWRVICISFANHLIINVVKECPKAKTYFTMCSLFPVSCFFTFCLFLLCNHFHQQLYFLLRISCFFRNSLTFISGDIKQKIG